MIDITKLTDNDKGRGVIYRTSFGDQVERGYITSWNAMFVFVRYTEVMHPERRARHGSTSESTRPEDLEWETP